MSRLKSILHLQAGLILALMAQSYSLIPREGEGVASKVISLSPCVLYGPAQLVAMWVVARGAEVTVKAKAMDMDENGVARGFTAPNHPLTLASLLSKGVTGQVVAHDICPKQQLLSCISLNRC